jgi:hypothetical protein
MYSDTEEIDIQTDLLANEKTDRQTDIQTDRQTGRLQGRHVTSWPEGPWAADCFCNICIKLIKICFFVEKIFYFERTFDE